MNAITDPLIKAWTGQFPELAEPIKSAVDLMAKQKTLEGGEKALEAARFQRTVDLWKGAASMVAAAALTALIVSTTIFVLRKATRLTWFYGLCFFKLYLFGGFSTLFFVNKGFRLFMEAKDRVPDPNQIELQRGEIGKQREALLQAREALTDPTSQAAFDLLLRATGSSPA